MRKRLFACALALGIWTIAAAQMSYKPVTTGQQASASQTKQSYPICGSPRLAADWERIGPVLEANAKSHPQQLKKTAGPWNFTVGQKRAWWASDLSTPNTYEYSVPSTCKAVGIDCYIFVEDSLWNSGRVDTNAVNAMEKAFDSSTPADSTKGIFQLDTQYFGNPPDVDKDQRIIILILDIKDGYNGSGPYVAGYFYSLNEYTEAQAQSYGSNRHSNSAEIYYVDGNPTNLKTPSGVTLASATTAHEFQHMINWNYSNINGINPLTFVNEGLSEAAMALCGTRSQVLRTTIRIRIWRSSPGVLLPMSCRITPEQRFSPGTLSNSSAQVSQNRSSSFRPRAWRGTKARFPRWDQA